MKLHCDDKFTLFSGIVRKKKEIILVEHNLALISYTKETLF
jgi:hypothetical protein